MKNGLRHVRPGDKLRIPASAYNAFVDTSLAFQKQLATRDGGPLDQRKSYDILIDCTDVSESDLGIFSVVCVSNPITYPVERLESFLTYQAHQGVVPSASLRSKFAILQEPWRVGGGLVRARITGLSICQVELLSPETTNDDYADINVGDMTCLKGAAYGKATILWTEPHADRVDPTKPWCVVNLGDNGIGQEFAVKVARDGGAAGGEGANCTWTYSVSTLRGKVFETAQTPTKRRLPLTEYDDTPDDTDGFGYYDHTGDFILVEANELPEVIQCDEEEVILDGGDSDF